MGYHRKMGRGPFIGEIVSERARGLGKCVILRLSKHGGGYLLRALDGGISFIAEARDFRRFSPKVRARVQEKNIEKYGLKNVCSNCGHEYVPMVPLQYVDGECLPCMFREKSALPEPAAPLRPA